ncbi:MAG TPA: hypothetical protein VF771_04285 [Longimicrobiaceae bacterium]
MKLIRIAIAAVALGTVLGACEARVTAPDQPRTVQKRSTDQSGTNSTTTNSTPPAPTDTTSRTQIVGSGG